LSNIPGDTLIRTALLQPRVPGRAHPGQLSYFLAPQTRGSPPMRRGEADAGGRDARPPSAQKIAQILPSDVVVSHGAGTSNQYFLYQYEECLWYWFNLTICFSLSTAPKPHYAISMFKPSPENRRMRNPKHERS